MGHLSAIFSCFSPSSSPRVSDHTAAAAAPVRHFKAPSSNNPKTKDTPKRSGAPIVMSYFPVNSHLSRL
ncbi:hypothetical protein U1Q18_023272 [Sarracenia purpurea var. burkii]